MKERLTYGWYRDKEPITVHVDLAPKGSDTQALPVLVRLKVPQGQKKLGFLGGKDKPAALAQKMAKHLVDVVWVGQLDLKDGKELVFYAKQGIGTEEVLLALGKGADRVEVECSLDENWECYYQKLLPNKAKNQVMLNRQWEKELKKRGISFNIPRKIAYICYFFKESDALGFAEKAKKYGFAIDSLRFEPYQEFSQELTLVKISDLSSFQMDTNTTLLIRLCEMLQGEFSHWEIRVVR